MCIVHHSYYYIYMETARFQFAQNLLGARHEDFVAWGVQVPVRQCECEYLVPARFGDTLIVGVWIVPAETASLHLRYTMVREHDGRLIARGKTMNVFVNMEGRLLVRTPEVIAERLRKAAREYPEILVTGRAGEVWK